MSYALIHKVAPPSPVTSSPLFRRHWSRFRREATGPLGSAGCAGDVFLRLGDWRGTALNRLPLPRQIDLDVLVRRGEADVLEPGLDDVGLHILD